MGRKKATIIYNPNSGRPRRREGDLRNMARLLNDRGIDASTRPTSGPNDATQLAREAVSSGIDIVVVYGGDGTLNEVIQGMAGSKAALAIWAGGTANVAARDLGLPFRTESLADVIAAGKTQRIALGLARLEVRDERSESRERSRSASGASTPSLHSRTRYFIMFAGIGLDASICRGVDLRLKRLAGQLAYWVSGIKHVFTWRPEKFVIAVDGSEFEATFALIGNGKGYGGGFRITPHARLEEPWFEICVVPPLKNNLAYLWELINFSGSKAKARLMTGRHVRANSTQEPWVEVDGEVLGPLPMSFDVVPDALTLIVP